MDKQEELYSIGELSTLLDHISWGHRIVEIKTLDGTEHTFAFRPLKLDERNAAQHVYNDALRRGKLDNIPERNELLLLVNREGLWNSKRDQEIEILRDELVNREEELSQTKFKSKKTKLVRRIKKIKNALEELVSIKVRLLDLPSLEYYANQQQAHYILHKSTLTFPALKPKWPNFEDLENEENTEIVFQLITKYHNYDVAEISKIRALARHGLWRIKWSAAKMCGNLAQLFDVGLSDITVDQQMLIYWSQVYDSVYEAYERPPDDVIEDDEQLDKWLEKEAKEREQERRQTFKSKKSNLGLGKANASNANEIMLPNEGFYSDVCTCDAKNIRGKPHLRSCTYGVFFYYANARRDEEIKGIHECNPDNIRLVLAKEKNTLQKAKTVVREEHLRHKDSLARNAMGFTTSIIKKDR
jgi:hypothetical protein